MMKHSRIFPVLVCLGLLFSCEKQEPDPDSKNLKPGDLTGAYCGIIFGDGYDFEKYVGRGLSCISDSAGEDSLIIVGEFTSFLDTLSCTISGDSLIIPEQIVYWTNQSPGGSTWQESVLYFGSGHYTAEEGKLYLRLFEWTDVSNDIPFVIEVVREEVNDITGSYYSNGALKPFDELRPIPSIDDEIHISEDPDSDSLIVNFMFAYETKVDSTLQHFKVDKSSCTKKFSIHVDSINTLRGELGGNGDYLRLVISRCFAEPLGPFHATCYTSFYRFSGFK
jgi:hypothetical protein